MNNLIKCKICNKWIIIEELEFHKCCHSNFKIVNTKYKWLVQTKLDGFGKVLLVEGQDGTLYRMTPIPPTFQHPFTTPKDSTEPIFIEKNNIFVISYHNLLLI